MGLEKFVNKLKKIKKEVIENANKGIQAVKSSPDAQDAKEVGKEILKEATGLKARLVQEGTNFVKTYMKENVTKENSTGATIGAFGEYLVKRTVKGVKAVADALTDYVENEANKYHKSDALPELDVVKELINQYAQDQQEMGSETLNYKGIEITTNKTEKSLSIALKRDTKAVSLTYLLKERQITDLNNDFELLTEDLVKRLDKLSDPTISVIDKTTKLKLPYRKGEQTSAKYTTEMSIRMKKESGMYKVTYTPENKVSGVILEYLQHIKPEPETPIQDDPIPDMLKDK